MLRIWRSIWFDRDTRESSARTYQEYVVKPDSSLVCAFASMTQLARWVAYANQPRLATPTTDILPDWPGMRQPCRSRVIAFTALGHAATAVSRPVGSGGVAGETTELPNECANDAGVFSLLIRWTLSRLAAVWIRRIMLLPATRSDDEGPRHGAIRRFGPRVTAGAQWLVPLANPVAECGLGRRCSRRRIRGEDAAGAFHSGRSRGQEAPGGRCRPISRRSHFAKGFEKPFAEARFQYS